MNLRLGYWGFQSQLLNVLMFEDGGWVSAMSAADSELYVRDIIASLRTGDADAAVLHYFETAHPIYEISQSLPGLLFSDHVPNVEIRRTRRLVREGSFFESLSRQWQNNQKKRARRILEAFGGDLRIDCFHDGGQIERLMTDAETVAKTSYQRGLGVGFMGDRQMYERLCLGARLGTLRGHVLYIADRPCAFWIASLSGGVLYSEFTAYDPAYARYGIGLYLIMEVIEEIYKDESTNPPATSIDFGVGEAEWKAHLSDKQSQVASFYIFAPTLKGAKLNLLRSISNFVNQCGKTILESTGALSHFKKKWRGRMTQRTAASGNRSEMS